MALMLTLALILSLLTACGGNPGGGDAAPTDPPDGSGVAAAEAETPELAFVETPDIEMDEATRGNTSSALTSKSGSPGVPAMAGGLILLQTTYITPDGYINYYDFDGDLWVYSINVKGDAVYFLNEREENDTNKVIYKMKSDCSGIEELFTADFPLWSLIMHGEWLYYSMLDQQEYVHYLCRVKIDGTVNEVILDGSIREDGRFVGGKYSIGMNAIYYASSSRIWKADLDGSNPRPLGDVILQIATELRLHGEWIYYNIGGQYGGQMIERVRTDGTGKMAVLDYEVYDYDFVGDEIYYIAMVQEGDKAGYNDVLYAIKDDGSGETRLIYDENTVSKIVVLGDVLYLSSFREYILYTDGRVIMEHTDYGPKWHMVGGW